MMKNPDKKQKSCGSYAVIGDCKVGERSVICEALSEKEAVSIMLESYEPPKHETYAVDLDVYNVTKNRERYHAIKDTNMVTHSLEHDGSEIIHRRIYMIHPIQPQCTGRHKLDHRYAFEGMSYDKKGRHIFREKCLDCHIEKTTKTGLETDYGSIYYSIEYKETTK